MRGSGSARFAGEFGTAHYIMVVGTGASACAWGKRWSNPPITASG